MGKFVRKALPVLSFAAGVALAPATGGASLLAAKLGVSSFAATAILGGVSIGASLLSGTSVPKSAVQLGRLQATLDPRAARKMVLGRTAMPVDLRYYEGSGEDERTVEYIAVCAAHRIQAFEQLWIEDELAWTASGGVEPQFQDYLGVEGYTEGGPAATRPINGGARWGSDDRLTGCAYLYLRVERVGASEDEQSPFAGGLPTRITVIGTGMQEYDPRFDSTVPGGSGDQRADNQDSWGPSTGNPIIEALNVLLGWRINGKLSVGGGIPPKYIDMQSVITAANICDEAIALSGGGTQPRYRTAGAFSTADPPMQVVATLLAGCAGDLLDANGKLSFLIKANTLSTPAVTLGEANLLSVPKWEPMGGQTNLPNIISGSFTDPGANSLYQLVPYPSVSLDSEDGIERIAPLDLAPVENGPQAERIAKQTLQRMQYPGRWSAEYDMLALAATVGSIVHINHAPLGWLAKPFRVRSQRVSRSGRIALVLDEENAAIYAWSAEDSAPVQAAAPVAFNRLNTGAILLARQATGARIPSADSDQAGNIKDQDGNFYEPGELLNSSLELTPGGQLNFRPRAEALPTLLGNVRLADLGAISEAAFRRASDDVEKLSEALAFALSEASKTRQTFSDAGFYTDPATGQVRISTVDSNAERVNEAVIRLDAAEASINLRATTTYVDEQIAAAVLDPSQIADLNALQLRIGTAELDIDALEATVTTLATVTELTVLTSRVTTAESKIDALEGQIATKVETSTFNALDTRVTTAENTLSAIGDTAQIVNAVTSVRQIERDQDASAESGLLALLRGDQNRRDQTAALATARQELRAEIGDGDTALAQQITTLQTSVAGNTASVTQIAESVDGLEARAGLILDVNGYVTGWALNNDGAQGDMVFYTDTFRLVEPGDDQPVEFFTVTPEGIRLRGDLVVEGSITTAGIADNAVTSGNSSFIAGATAVGTTAVQVASVVLTTTGGDVRVDFSGSYEHFNAASNVAIAVSFTVKRDSTIIASGQYCSVPATTIVEISQDGSPGTIIGEATVPGAVNGTFPIFVVDTTAPAGEHTYSVELVSATGSGLIQSRRMIATEFKK